MVDKGKILTGYWENDRRVVVMLREDWKSRVNPPPLFLGPEPVVSFDKIEKAPLTEYGRMAHYFIRKDTLTFLMDPSEDPKRGLDKEPVYVVGSFNGWKEACGQESWRMYPETVSGKKLLALHIPRLRLRKYIEPGAPPPHSSS